VDGATVKLKDNNFLMRRRGGVTFHQANAFW
jgi:hypothetical protein